MKHTMQTVVAVLATSAAGMALAAAPAAAGDGRFGAGEELGGDSISAAVGDFNSDGRPDVASVNWTNGAVRVRLGKAGGGFKEAPGFGVNSGTAQVVVADFNADGNDDLAITNVMYRHVSVSLGKGDGMFDSAPDIKVTRNPWSLVVGDFNRDNREDLAIATADSDAAVVVRLGKGDGTFANGADVKVSAATLAVGDFNSDGIEDLAFERFGPEPAGVLIGTGGGAFTVGENIALPGSAESARALAVGDFNADGNQDVAAAVSAKDVVSVRLGKGDGSFGGGTDVAVGDDPRTPAVGDFDSDGNDDLAVTSYEDHTVNVRLGDGAGGFASAADVKAGYAPVDLALADFDSDGTEDLAVANLLDSVSIRPGLGAPPLAGNLLVNGEFEGPGAAATPAQAPAIPGWERSGGITFARYGLPSHAHFPSRLAAPRYGTGRLSMLWGGNSAATGGITEAFQTVDVSGSAASIDAGLATADLSAHLGGALAYGDRMAARAEFLDAAGATLGSFQIGPVTAADRKALTTLVRRAGSAPVPAGSRSIRVTLTSTDDDKSYSSAVADNVKLTLTVSPAPSPAQPGPEPGPGPRAFERDALVTLALARRRFKPRQPVTVRVTNRNSFAVTGTLRATPRRGRIRARPLQVRPSASATVRLTLPRPLRRQLERRRALALRLTARVRDPAGRTRTVTKRVRVRRAG